MYNNLKNKFYTKQITLHGIPTYIYIYNSTIFRQNKLNNAVSVDINFFILCKLEDALFNIYFIYLQYKLF